MFSVLLALGSSMSFLVVFDLKYKYYIEIFLGKNQFFINYMQNSEVISHHQDFMFPSLVSVEKHSVRVK